jgi:DNA repair protein RecO (recombination protein O)
MTVNPRSIRTPAIILRRRDRGEADRIITVLTPQLGKIDLIAHGARKPAGRKTGHIELFALVDMLISRLRQPGTLSQAEMIEGFIPIRDDLTLSAYASYAVELLDRFTEQDDEDNAVQLFDLLRDTLARLAEYHDKRLALRYYELQLLDIVGYRPALHSCVICGESIQPEAQFFSVTEGGVVCHDCGTNNPNYATLSFYALKLLRHLQRSDFGQIRPLRVEDTLHQQVEALMVAYLTYTLERQLQSVEFIRRLRRITG